MPLTINHVLTATTPDNTQYEIRPSHWNETHSASINAVGSEISGAFSNAVGGVTFGLETNGYVTASAPSAAGGLTNINVSAGTTSQNLSALTFSNSNGLAFGLNGSVITGSYTVPTQSIQTQNMVSVQGSTGDVQFANGNGVTFGFNASTITASHNGLTSQSNQALSAGNGSFAFQTASFSNANGISFSTSAGSAIVASHNGITSQSVQTQNMVSVQGSTGAISFGNANGVTFGFNASTVTASHNGLTSQSNQAVSAAGGSSAFQTLVFTNSNGVSWTNTNGSIAASVATTYRASNDAIGLNTAQSNVTWTVNSSGLSLDARGYAGTGTTFAGANLSGSMTLNSNGLNLSMSAAAPGGGGAINVSAGTTSNNLQTVVFSNSNGVSFGLDGSTVTASVNAGGGTTLNVFEPYEFANNSAFSSHGQNSVYFQRIWPEFNYQFSQIEKIASVSFVSSTNSQAVSHTIQYGLYSRDTGTNSTRMTRAGSSAIIFQASYNSNTAAGFTISQSGGGSFTSTSAGTALFSQMTAGKVFYLPFTSTMSQGVEYAFAFNVSTASAVNTGAARLSFLELTNLNNTTLGRLAVTTAQAGSATIYEEWDGLIYSTTSGALPTSYQNNQCSVAVSRARQYLIFEVE